MPWWLYVIVIIYSLTFNWFVQLGYYVYSKKKDPQAFAGQRTLLNYLTGPIGDGIVVPLINICMTLVLYKLAYWPRMAEFVGTGLAALLIDGVAHYLQGKLKLVNWSMPIPFNWNFAGKWHMISFPIQIGYILLFLYIVERNLSKVLATSDIKYLVASVFGLMISFMLLFIFDNTK